VRFIVIVCWSVKGGVGTTVVSCGLALQLATTAVVLLVDLGADVSGALGLPAESTGPAIGQHLGVEVPVSASLTLARASLASTAADVDAAIDAWTAVAPTVVVDAGRLDPTDRGAARLLARASNSLLVLRPCFLALRRAAAIAVRPSGVVLVDEKGRSITADDVRAVLGVPLVAIVPHDPAIARAVDAGVLAARVPRSLQRALAGVVACA
jgi:hypothetical protein